MNEITLYQAPTRPWKSPNMSPFCAKLELYLRITEVPHKLAAAKFTKTPKGKIPYVDFGDGVAMGDSGFIIEELERRRVAEGKPALDAGMSPRDAATARLLVRALEEGFYFVGVYGRWIPDAPYAIVKQEFKKFVPGIIVPVIRRGMRKKLHEQGTGRHTEAEVMKIGAADLAACAEILGDKPFLFGEAPRTADCTLFAFLAGSLAFPLDTALKHAIQSHPNLVTYHDRIRERWWKDLAS
jgi:glutathione S-transferase